MSRFVEWFVRVPVRPLVILLAVGISLMAMVGIGAAVVDPGNLWFDLDSEIAFAWPPTNSTIALPALWSGSVLLAAAGAWLAVWHDWPRDWTRPLVLVVSLFLLLMGGDELAWLHERLEKRLGVDWQVLYALPVLLMGVATVVLLLRMRRPSRQAAVMLALGCLAWAAAQVLEFIQWSSGEKAAGYVPMMISEELLEVTGSALFLVSGVVLVKALVAAQHPSQRAATAAGAGQAVGT